MKFEERVFAARTEPSLPHGTRFANDVFVRRKNMLKIMMLPDTEKFLSVVDQSQGNVFLRLPNQTQLDLKKDAAARQMLYLIDESREGLQIDLTDQSDAAPFLRYLTEAAYAG